MPVWGGSVVATNNGARRPGRRPRRTDRRQPCRTAATEAASAYRSSKGDRAGIYKGVLLWDLLQARGLVGRTSGPRCNTVLAIAGDGHEGRLFRGRDRPDFGNTPILLAYEMNGQPIPDRLRMVVPGDMRGARHIKGHRHAGLSLISRRYGSCGAAPDPRPDAANSRNHALGLAGDGVADGLPDQRIVLAGAQRRAQVGAILLPKAHMNSSPVQVSRTRLQLSQKLWLSGVMKPIFWPVSSIRT